jgi:hypothetical protein
MAQFVVPSPFSERDLRNELWLDESHIAAVHDRASKRRFRLRERFKPAVQILQRVFVKAGSDFARKLQGTL